MLKYIDWKKTYARARSIRVQRPRSGIGPNRLWVCTLGKKNKQNRGKRIGENLGFDPMTSCVGPICSSHYASCDACVQRGALHYLNGAKARSRSHGCTATCRRRRRATQRLQVQQNNGEGAEKACGSRGGMCACVGVARGGRVHAKPRARARAWLGRGHGERRRHALGG